MPYLIVFVPEMATWSGVSRARYVRVVGLRTNPTEYMYQESEQSSQRLKQKRITATDAVWAS